MEIDKNQFTNLLNIDFSHHSFEGKSKPQNPKTPKPQNPKTPKPLCFELRKVSTFLHLRFQGVNWLFDHLLLLFFLLLLVYQGLSLLLIFVQKLSTKFELLFNLLKSIHAILFLFNKNFPHSLLIFDLSFILPYLLTWWIFLFLEHWKPNLKWWRWRSRRNWGLCFHRFWFKSQILSIDFVLLVNLKLICWLDQVHKLDVQSLGLYSSSAERTLVLLLCVNSQTRLTERMPTREQNIRRMIRRHQPLKTYWTIIRKYLLLQLTLFLLGHTLRLHPLQLLRHLECQFVKQIHLTLITLHLTPHLPLMLL